MNPKLQLVLEALRVGSLNTAHLTTDRWPTHSVEAIISNPNNTCVRNILTSLGYNHVAK